MKVTGVKYNIAIVIVAALALAAQNVLAKDWVYTVRQGDTLWGLCEKYTNRKDCWLKLGPYNQVEFPRTLAPGTRIRFPVAWLLEPPEPVVVIFVNGEVSTQTDIGPRPLNAEDTLGIGSTIEVGPDSLAIVRFADGSTMTVEPGSSLFFDRLSSFGETGMVDTKVNLQKGAVQTQVVKRQPPSHFEVQTPSAVAAVRGTDFRVAAETDTQMRSEVFDGEINVANASGDAQVAKGKGLLAEKDRPLPEVVSLPPAPEMEVPEGPASLPYTLHWPIQDNVQSYRLRIVDADGVHVRQQDIGGQSLTLNDLNNACYTFALSALHASGFQSLPAQAALCFLPALATPVALNSTRDDQSMTLRWASVPGAQSYRVDIGERPDFDGPVRSLVTSETQARVEVESPNALYVRVVAIADGAIDSAPSSTATVEPPAPKEEGRGLLMTLLGVVVTIMIAL